MCVKCHTVSQFHQQGSAGGILESFGDAASSRNDSSSRNWQRLKARQKMLMILTSVVSVNKIWFVLNN